MTRVSQSKENELATEPDRLVTERQRILEENARRRRQVDSSLYHPDNPAERHLVSTRIAAAKRMLVRASCQPSESSVCLEVGVGSTGWLPVFSSWGVAPSRQLGFDLDLHRVRRAVQDFHKNPLWVADGTACPLRSDSIDLVVTSTVFSSILDSKAQQNVAEEITRVLRPGGALLFYDLRLNNPKNPHVRGVSARRLAELFEPLEIRSRWISVAPPILRRAVRIGSWAPALLELIPPLRSHLIAVGRKPSAASEPV